LRLRESDGKKAPSAGEPADESREKARPKTRQTIVCAACGHAITDSASRMERAGRHQHTCVNPAGIVYRIGCFRDAPGCVSVGPSSTYYSWFSGCAWQVAVCGGCTAHLGWAFADADARFHGLILARLAERDEP